MSPVALPTVGQVPSMESNIMTEPLFRLSFEYDAIRTIIQVLVRYIARLRMIVPVITIAVVLGRRCVRADGQIPATTV